MPLPVLQRNYNMTDSDLRMLVSNLVGFMLRPEDALEFANYGVDADAVNEFKSLGVVFELFPTDEMLLADVTIATENKNLKTEALLTAIRNVTNRALNKWGENSGKYKKYGVTGLYHFNDRDLLFAARRVHTVGMADGILLADQGLTPAMLTDLNTAITNFETALNTLKDAQADRDIKAEERITKGNELYSYVSRYCEIGKQIWANVSEARYNDYIIYSGASPGSLTAPDNFQYHSDLKRIAWNPVDNATSYQLMISNDAAIWTEYYAGTDCFAPMDPPIEGTRYFKVRARNDSGYGPFTTNLHYSYYPTLDPPSGLTLDEILDPQRLVLRWAAVEGADDYYVYRSVVAIGQPEGTYSNVGNNVPCEHTEGGLVVPMRYYYKVIAHNSLTESEFSSPIFKDLYPPA